MTRARMDHAAPTARSRGRSLPVGPLLGALGLVIVAAFPLLAQQADGGIRAGALRVFLDCNAFPCDDDYFRTEVGFVNWVRDRTLADVHLIITSNETGGGEIYTLDYQGLQELAGDDEVLTVTALSTDTQDEILSQLSAVIAAGLARYSAAIGQATTFTITPTGGVQVDTDTLVSAEDVQDPWNFWVFEISGDVEFEGEDTERQSELGGGFEASRTTETWKVEFEADGEFSTDERESSDGDIVRDERTNWNTDLLLARTLADNWSLGMLAGASASTRLNQSFGAQVAAAIEYSFFPYEEAPRRSLTARYDLGLAHFDWDEETIFGETAETRLQHQVRLQLFQRQPWGQSVVYVDASQFLHDGSKWAVAVGGFLEFRILRGLNLELRANQRWIEDQIFISGEGLTDEDILLGRFERPTDSAYEFAIGLSYEFGSIFNNVVNNRFDGPGFGGGGGGFN